MQNKQTLSIPQTSVISGATVAAVTAAALQQINTVAGNTYGLTDVTGAPIGAQTVAPGTISVGPIAVCYDATATAEVYAITVNWVETIQLT